MDTKKLRQKILDLAIHGKLVPQDPNDEPASVLLERIRAEKERLIAEGKIKRSKKSATSDTSHYENVPFEVPEGWCWCKVTEVLTKLTDGTHHSPTSAPTGDFKYVTAKNIKPWGIDLSDITYVDKATHDEIYTRCNPEIGDILYIKDGATTGVACVNDLNEPFSLLSSVALLKPSKQISNRFLLAYLQSSICYDTVRESMKGVGITRITLKIIENWDIPLPPYHEQEKIADSVELWMREIDMIETNSCNIKLYVNSLKSKILDLAIHGKLVPQDVNDEPAPELLKRINPETVASCDNPHYGILPENWCWVKLGQLFNIVSAKRVTKDQWKSVGVPFYRTREIVQLSQNGHVDNDLFIDIEHYESLKNKYGIPRPGDIMLTAVGTIGKTYVVSQDDKFYYKDASVLCMKNVHNINSKYIELAFCSTLVQKQLYEKSKGTTVDTITIEKANNYIFPIPPIEEQNRIVVKVNELFSQLDLIEKSLQA